MPRTVKTTAKLGKEDYELLAQFRYALRKFIGFSEAAARGEDFVPAQVADDRAPIVPSHDRQAADIALQHQAHRGHFRIERS